MLPGAALATLDADSEEVEKVAAVADLVGVPLSGVLGAAVGATTFLDLLARTIAATQLLVRKAKSTMVATMKSAAARACSTRLHVQASPGLPPVVR